MRREFYRLWKLNVTDVLKVTLSRLVLVNTKCAPIHIPKVAWLLSCFKWLIHT